MAKPAVLRLRRTDADDQHILLNVSQKGSKALDLKLIGTEHEHLFHGELKESNVKSLQASNYSGDLEEWKATLRAVLLHERPEDSSFLDGLETVAAISGETLTITLRKNISGITQRLGSIKLQQDDDREAVDIFSWVDAAVATSDGLRSELATLQASVDGHQDQVAKLEQQLDELIKAKREHEDEMLKKFAALLNAKKLKIRDQQRLLNGAKVDPEAAQAVNEARSDSGRNAGSSRDGKRKANGVSEPELEDEKMEEDEDEAAFDDEELRRQDETPAASEDEATEDEDEEQQASATAAKFSQRGEKASKKIDEPLPPKRELPFQRKGEAQTSTSRQSVTAAGDDGDEETDDEL